MKQVEVTFDSQFETWNVMLGSACLTYGTAWDCDRFMSSNKNKYYEVIK